MLMPESSAFGKSLTELDDTSADAYRQSVLLGSYVRSKIAETLDMSLDEATRIEETLLRLRLLHPMPGEPDVLVPISPDAAVADLLGPAESHIREMQQSVTDVRTRILALMPLYFEGRKRRNKTEGFDVISDVGVVQSMIDEWADHCTEMLTAQPGGSRSANMMSRARPVTLALLRRGVRIRHLYQHTIRSDLMTAGYVREVSAEGAKVRTTDQLIDRMIIYNREIVFLPEQNIECRAPGAVVVREPTLVAFLCKVYDHLWDSGTVFESGADQHSSVTDNLKRSIIRLMSQGHKDEMVARRLGMSVRTCRRHISQIMEELESTSRFQAGVNAALARMMDEQAEEWPEPGNREPTNC